jgi:hypothetical protein
LNRPIIGFSVVLALTNVALAQQTDPTALIFKLEDLQFLLDAREQQIARDRGYWAAYVAGLNKPADANDTPPSRQVAPGMLRVAPPAPPEKPE